MTRHIATAALLALPVLLHGCDFRCPGDVIGQEIRQEFLGGDSTRIVLRESVYSLRSCGRLPAILSELVSETFVALDPATLQTTAFEPPANPDGFPPTIHTDGHLLAFETVVSAAATQSWMIQLTIRDLDTGSELVFQAPGHAMPLVLAIAKPFVLLAEDPVGGASDPVLLDTGTGGTRTISPDWIGPPALSATDLVRFVSSTEIRRLDLTTDHEDAIPAASPDLTRGVAIAGRRLVWVENTAAETRIARAYGIDSGVTTTVTEWDERGAIGTPPSQFAGAGEPGVLIERQDRFYRYDLVAFDGSMRATFEQDRSDLPLTVVPPQFAGRHVLYPTATGWIIYDAQDGSSRSFTPFAPAP